MTPVATFHGTPVHTITDLREASIKHNKMLIIRNAVVCVAVTAATVVAVKFLEKDETEEK